MALSNIFREPRREIIEQVVGAILALPVIVLWVCSTSYFGAVYECPAFRESPCWVGAALTPPLLACLIFIGLIAIHEIGDQACNALERRGVHLRPRNRNITL